MPRLEQRLQDIDQRLGEIAGSGSESPGSSAEDQLRMLEDRASTLECIKICRQAQQEMQERIRLMSEADDSTTMFGESSTEPVVPKPVLQGWHDRLDTLANHLENSIPPKVAQSKERRRRELEQERDSLREQISVYKEYSRVVAGRGVLFHNMSAGPSAFQGIQSQVGHGLVADNIHVGRNGFQALGQYEGRTMSEAIQAHQSIRGGNKLAENDSLSNKEATPTVAQMTEHPSRNSQTDHSLIGRWQMQQRVTDTVDRFRRRKRESCKKGERSKEAED